MWSGPLLSGIGHAALIALAIETLPWLRAHDERPPAVVSVTLLTPADLAALAPADFDAPVPADPPAPAAPVPAAAGPTLPVPDAATAPPGGESPAAAVPPAPDVEADPEATESLAPAFDPAAPLGLAAAEDPATAALARDFAPEDPDAPAPLAVPRPATTAAPAPLIITRPAAPAARPLPRAVAAPPAAVAARPPEAPLGTAPRVTPPTTTTQGPRIVAPPDTLPAPRTGPPPDTVLGPVFVDGPAAEPTLRPNLPPAPGAGISTYVPPLPSRGIPGDSPALRRAPAGAQEAAASAYQAAIRDAVLAAQSYPPEAMTRGVEGAAGLKVVVRRDGRLVTAILLRSSGSSTLDRAALEAARHAILPAAPPTLAGDRFAADVTLAFRLDGAATLPDAAPEPLSPDGG